MIATCICQVSLKFTNIKIIFTSNINGDNWIYLNVRKILLESMHTLVDEYKRFNTSNNSFA